MKKIVSIAVAGLMLAGCTQEEAFVNEEVQNQKKEISFSMATPAVTRAVTGEEAATKLGNNFVVYGFKNGDGVTEEATGAKDQKVFIRYNVNYVKGSANTTLSNTDNWEYVGYTSLEGKEQTIKYWDYAASQYVFSAVSCQGCTPTKIEGSSESGATVYDKGWKFTIPQGGKLSQLYGSKRTVIKKSKKGSDPTYSYETVNLEFFSLITKIRFAIYETVPGYSVKIDKFYYGTDQKSESTDAFAINGMFKGLNKSGSTEFTVTYYDSTSVMENRPKLTYGPEAEVGTYQLFGDSLTKVEAIGTTSNTASYDAGGEYACILPYQSLNETDSAKMNNPLQLKIDFTLKAADSDEEIKVYGATAEVPTAYTQWKENYAYTYIFKISDNTNGTPGDPNDPLNPKGLYPITFDVCVAGDEDGTQEVISIVTNPTITTYQDGSEVTKDNEYKAGNITARVYDPEVVGSKPIGDVTLTKSNFKLYLLANTGKTTLTEANVANYMNNDLVLTDISNSLKGLGTTSVTFKGETGKTYVAEYKKGADKFYKIIKVKGTAATPVFRFEAYESAICAPETETDTVMESAKIYVKVKQMISSKEYCVAGAEKNFDATTTQYFDVTAYNDTVYKLTSKAGIDNDVDVPLGIKNVNTASSGSATITIINYHFTLNGGNVKAGSTNNDILWLYRSDKLHKIDLATQFKVYKDDVDVTSQNMLKITGNSKADGKYDIEVADDAAGKYVVNYYNGTATCEITVDTFAITPTYSSANVKALNVGGIAAEKSATLTLKCGGALAKSYAVTNAAPTVATLAGEDGSTHKASTHATTATIVLTAKAAGTAKVTAPGEFIEIPVYNFAVKFYTDATCTSEFTGSSFDASKTYYAKFTDNGTPTNAPLQVSCGTWVKASADGVYKWTAPATTDPLTVTYKFKGNTFTLFTNDTSESKITGNLGSMTVSNVGSW